MKIKSRQIAVVKRQIDFENKHRPDINAVLQTDSLTDQIPFGLNRLRVPVMRQTLQRIDPTTPAPGRVLLQL